jgi:hypothetical protein
MISGSPKHIKKSYRVSGKNPDFGKIAIKDIKVFVSNDTYTLKSGEIGETG